MIQPSRIRNKAKRQAVAAKQKTIKSKQKRERRAKRKREEEALGAAAPKRPVSQGGLMVILLHPRWLCYYAYVLLNTRVHT
jgi:hypothetical protein